MWHVMSQVSSGEAEDGAAGSEKRAAGRVVGVIRRNWRGRGYAGSLAPPKPGAPVRRSGWVLFRPIERKFPCIRISTRQVRQTVMHARAALDMPWIV